VTTSGPVILVVDDEESVRQVLRRILEEGGFTVIEADNGSSALQVVRRSKGGISLVITDITMPVMDGLELARALQASNPGMPILFITGKDPALLAQTGPNARVLLKPFGPALLLATVRRIIARSDDARSAD
jgi:two-component system, cell cycle sensor histidine kinase and response regulator CckA